MSGCGSVLAFSFIFVIMNSHSIFHVGQFGSLLGPHSNLKKTSSANVMTCGCEWMYNTWKVAKELKCTIGIAKMCLLGLKMFLSE